MKTPPSLIAALVYLATFPALHAVPASGTETRHLQPDGQTIHLRNAGDEWFHWHETPEGYVVSKDSDGYWKYAQPEGERAELKPMAQAIVGKAEPEKLGLRKKNLPSRAMIKNGIRELKSRVPPSPLKTDDSGKATSPSTPSAKATIDAPSGSAPTGPWGRTVKSVIILAAFSDHWNNALGTVYSSKGRPREEYNDLFNTTGYNTGGAVGSVKDFYLQNSYGEMTIESTITVWVKLPQTQAWYGDNANEVAGGQRCRQLALDAINAADAAGFNFSQFDSDADGYVDLLHIIYSGHSEAWSGNPSTAVWPRQWELYEAVYRDGLMLNTFSMSEAIKGAAATSTSICTIGVICHELGHQFGLPDLYDSSGEFQGVGTWCCMGYGSWGATASGDGRQPVNFSAHCRHMMGFIKPRTMFTSERADLPRIYDNPVAHLIVPMASPSSPSSEYFLIENRQRLGFDSQLPGDGILIWHIVSTEWDNDSYDAIHPAVRLEEAAGGDTLATSRYATTAHLWHSGNGLTGGFSDTTGNFNTNAMKYQTAYYYGRVNSSASHSKIRIQNFSSPASVMSYDLQTVVPKIASQSVPSANYTVSWSPSSDANTYQLQEGQEGTTNLFLDDAETDDDFWRLWTTTGLVLRSNARAYSGSHSYRMAPWDDDSFNYISSPHSMQLNQGFVLTPSTTLSLRILSHVSIGTGYLNIELSKDGGVNWTSIDKIAGYSDPWILKSYTYQNLLAKGFVSGDLCHLRFSTRMGEIWGWPDYPSYGFALDYIRLSGIQMPVFHSWVNAGLASSSTTRPITNKPPGRYAYRTRAQVGGIWQPYSDSTVIERLPTHYETWASAFPADMQNMTDDADQDGVVNAMEYALGRQGNSNVAPHDTTQLPVVSTQVFSGGNRLTLTFDLPDTPPPGTTYLVQVANDLADTWSTILSKNGTSNWTGAAPFALTPQSDQRTKHAVYDVLSIHETPLQRRFMRLQVILQP